MLTTVSLGNYFTHPEFEQYFLNIAGYIHYHLPGVFTTNPVPRTVNGSLWTVPYEAECYFALAAVSFIGLVKRPKLFASALLAVTLALFVWTLVHGDAGPARNTLTGRQLVLFFLSGVLTYLWRDRVRYSGWLALAAVAVSLALVTSHLMVYLLPIPVAYLTAYIGLQTPGKLPVIFKGDYSYGIYLYAFPVQQAVAYLLPQQPWYLNFAVALVFVSMFAAFSWHCVEKPTLRLKRFITGRRDTSAAAKPEMRSPAGVGQAGRDGGKGLEPAKGQLALS
jgi:peptidoglycan/LPS O-acetylase OafA/YrhL